MNRSITPPSIGKSGMVSTPHPVATKAGVDILSQGGNAIDAAIAANAALTVLLPDQCGLGGDLFAIIFNPTDGKIYGINGSGPAPSQASLEKFAQLGISSMPQLGPLSVTIPGAVEAWEKMNLRFGTLPLSNLLKPAVLLAENGFPINQSLANSITEFALPFLKAGVATEVFFRNGKPLTTGDILVQKKLSGTLNNISNNGACSFYKGQNADHIAQSVQNFGGVLCSEDLHQFQAEWVKPIHTAYRGHQVFTLPPNSAGLLLLAMVQELERNNLENVDFQSVKYISACVNIVRKVIDNFQKWVSDPNFVGLNWQEALDNGFKGFVQYQDNHPPYLKGDTIALCTADRSGMGVTLIQSIYHDFGSGVYVDEAGIFLQNRGASFSLDPFHPNCLAPGKRPGHTLTPALVTGENGLELLFGSRGGAGQPQTLMQILSSIFDYGMDIETALSGPRWIYGSTTSARKTSGLVLENRFPPEYSTEFSIMGIPVTVTDDFSAGWMGVAQGIQVDKENNRFIGAADPRSGGLALGIE